MRTFDGSLMPRDMDEQLVAKGLPLLPEYCREGLLNFLRHGLMPGQFLQAVLSNDLLEACRFADDVNKRAIADYVFVLVNYAPASAWGSRENVRAWIEAGQAARAAEGVES